MKKRKFIVGLTTFLITTGLLFGIGYMFEIPWLMFHHEFTDPSTGLYTITGSVAPVVLGIMFSYFSERIINR